MELALIITVLCFGIGFLTLMRVTKEADEWESLARARTEGLKNAEFKVDQRNKLIEDYQNTLTKIVEILDLEMISIDKCEKIRELANSKIQH